MKSNSIWRALALLSLCHATLASKRPRHTLTWHTFDCVPNPKYYVDVKCEIVQPARTHINFYGTITEDLDEFWTELIVLVPRPPDNKFVKIFNFNLNLCEMMEEMQRQQMFRIIAESVLRFSNWPKKCPIKKGNYYHRNVSFVENLPEFFPESDLRAHFNCYASGKTIINVTLVGHLSEVVRGWFKSVKKN